MSIAKVFITGAGGFVGGRVAHRVALGEEMEPKPLVHSPHGSGTIRLARLPVDIEVGSILDRERMTDLVEDCDAVVNCAFGMGETSVVGTRVLLEVAEQTDVESFVHLSSAVVHGHDLEGVVDESRPLDPDTEYGEWKAKGERFIRDFAERSTLQPTVIRPFIVYGPYGQWVPQARDHLRDGFVLADGGHGTLNQIYVDNLVDVILQALEEPDAAGEVFMAVDDDDVSWRQFYADVSRTLDDHPPMLTMSKREIEARKKARLLKDSVVPPARILEHTLASIDIRGPMASELSRTPWAEGAFKRLPKQVRQRVLESLSGDERATPFESLHSNSAPSNGVDTEKRYQLPSTRYMKMQTSTGAVSNSKTKEVLGWEQRVTYDEAMDLISQWLAYEGLA